MKQYAVIVQKEFTAPIPEAYYFPGNHLSLTKVSIQDQKYTE